MNKCIRESRSFLMLGEVFVCTCQRMAGILCVYLRRMYENNLMHSKEFNKKKNSNISFGVEGDFSYVNVCVC